MTTCKGRHQILELAGSGRFTDYHKERAILKTVGQARMAPRHSVYSPDGRKQDQVHHGFIRLSDSEQGGTFRKDAPQPQPSCSLTPFQSVPHFVGKWSRIGVAEMAGLAKLRGGDVPIHGTNPSQP